MRINQHLLNLLIFSVLLIAERFTKWLVVTGNYNYQINQGISFSLFTDTPIELITTSVIIFLFGFTLFFLREKHPPIIRQLCFVLIISGGISNLLDRIIFGGAIDYIFLPYLPVFNFADIFIVSGSLIYSLTLFRVNTSKSN